MDTKTTTLISLLGETSSCLKTYNETHWSQWLLKSKRMLEAGKPEGVEHLVGAFGGMGSFNDLILNSRNGHTVSDNDTEELNKKLNDYREKLTRLADQLKEEGVFEN